MLFIAQWQTERIAGTLTTSPTDENAPAEPTDDHGHEEVLARV